jgi:hypothetical protein
MFSCRVPSFVATMLTKTRFNDYHHHVSLHGYMNADQMMVEGAAVGHDVGL